MVLDGGACARALCVNNFVLVFLVINFQRPVGALIDASETEAESHSLYQKVPADLSLSMKTFSVNNVQKPSFK